MNAKRNLLIALSIFICFVLQSTVFKTISFNGISPNLLMTLTVAFGLMYGKKCGIVTGFLSGLFIDIFFGSALCFYALIYMYIGYINGFFNRIFFKEDVKLPLALITGSDLTYGLICYILLFLLRGRFHFVYYFLHIILPEIVYTIVVAVFLYPFLLWIHGHIDRENKGSLSID